MAFHQNPQQAIKLFILVIFIGILILCTPIQAGAQLQIQDLKVTPADTSAFIEFTTSKEASIRIDFGPTDQYGLVTDAGYGKKTNHSITLSNLNPETTYHFRINAFSAEGALSTFDRTFTTLKSRTKGEAPIISNVHIAYITGSTATIQWETNEPATSVVRYGATETYTASRGSDRKSTIHDVTLTGLKLGAQYHFRVASTDKDGNTSVYSDMVFLTPVSLDGERIPLEISDIRPLTARDENLLYESAVISWKTNKLTIGSITWGLGARLSQSVSAPAPRNFEHRIKLLNLKPGTTYSFQVHAKDVFGKKAASPRYTFQTRSLLTTAKTGEQPVNGMSFLARFDENVRADFARGDPEPSVYGSVSVVADAGRSGGAVLLGEKGNIVYSGVFNFTITQGTVAFWIKPTWKWNDGKTHDFFSLNPNYGKKNEQGFLISKVAAIKRIRNPLWFFIEDAANGSYSHIVPDVTAQQNQWLHIAVTWKFGGKSILYINGVQRASSDLKGPVPELGSRMYLGYGTGSTEAYVDDFVIYDRPFTNEDIEILYKGGVIAVEQRMSEPVRVLGVSTAGITTASALLKSAADAVVYAILNGQRYHIPNPRSFARYGYQWSQVTAASQEAVSRFPVAQLVKSVENDKVYFLYERPLHRLKLHIPTPAIFHSYPKNTWGKVVIIDQSDIDSFPSAELVKARSRSTVYVLEAGVARPFMNAKAFEQGGYQFQDVVEISEAHLGFFTLGTPIEQ